MNAEAALSRLAVYDLPGVDLEPITVDDPDELLALAERRHVVAQLAGAYAAGLVAGVTDKWVARLGDRHRSAVATTLSTHAALRTAADQLRNAGVTDFRVLKGCATGHLDYPRASDRFSSDVDLLIRPVDYATVLTTLGVVPVVRGERWAAQGYSKSVTVSLNGVEHDLHLKLTPGYFGFRVPTEELFAGGAPFVVAGVPVAGLGLDDRLLHAVLHVGGSKLVLNLNSVIDVPRLLLCSGAEWRSVVARAQAWGVDSMLALGVAKTWSLVSAPPHPLHEWALAHRSRGRQRIAIEIMQRRPRGSWISPLLALPPWRWPGYAWPLLSPTSGHLEWAGKTRLSRLGEIAREMAGRSVSR